MTYKQATLEFNSTIRPSVPRGDIPAIREAWCMFVDSLQRAGRITLQPVQLDRATTMKRPKRITLAQVQKIKDGKLPEEVLGPADALITRIFDGTYVPPEILPEEWARQLAEYHEWEQAWIRWKQENP